MNLKRSILMGLSLCSIAIFSYAKPAKGVVIYTTAEKQPYRLAMTDKQSFKESKQPLETEVCVFVNPKKSFQTVVGIGGAITDASAEVFARLPKTEQQKFVASYYDKSAGIGYSLVRTNINSCDFSSSSYTYVSEGDKSLASFTIAHDLEFKIPLIKEAFKAAGSGLVLFASPWSPPAYMKDNNNMLRGGKLLPEYYQPWANYFAKFIHAYRKEGIPVWGITIQNEPMATQKWESCIFSAEAERDFLKNNLGPTLKREKLSDVKVMVWDHNRDLMPQRANTIFGDPAAAKFAWGMGFHWYENWSGGDMMFQNVKAVAEAFPTKKLFFTEGCVEKFDTARYQYWPNAERYAISMINDFNNGIVGWTDWNVLLDETGGPNHVGNFCFAPVHADLKSGKLIYTPTYYYIGHFSKFVRPNAKRISATCSRSCLMSTAFRNANGECVAIVLNKGNDQIYYNLVVDNQRIEVLIPPHAMQTLTF